ncbi:HNH endonuclease [Jiangella alkaliphila]|nr:HNH endonuclease [Jiangella alkaliphila]
MTPPTAACRGPPTAYMIHGGLTLPFFQVDDRLHVNRKAMRLAELALSNDPMGFAALGVWTLAGSKCQDSGTDGVVTRAGLLQIVLNPPLADALAHLLVDAGLWHPAGHDCSRCPAVDAGTWLFHDWFALGYDPAATVRITRAQRKELQSPRIRNAVWARDCLDPAEPNIGACRYCGRRLNRNDRKGDTQPTIDHVDPTLALGPRNLVLCCKPCNQRKGRRTPEQAEMDLRPAPRALVDDTPVVAAAEPSQGRSPATTDAVPPTGAGSNRYPPDIQHSGAVLVHAYGAAGVPAGWSGSGRGKPVEQGQPPPAARRRRRRGRGGRADPDSDEGPQRPAQPRWDAGPAPEVPTPGRFGSPWHGWTGPASTVDDEATCTEHGLPDPCRKCTPLTEGANDG